MLPRGILAEPIYQSVYCLEVARLLSDGYTPQEVGSVLHDVYKIEVDPDAILFFQRTRLSQYGTAVRRFDEIRQARERTQVMRDAFSVSLELPPVLAGLCIDLHELEGDNKDLRRRVLDKRDSPEGPDIPLEELLRRNRLLSLDFRKAVLNVVGVNSLPAVEGIARDVAVMAIRVFCPYLPETEGRTAVGIFKTELQRLIGG